MKLSPSTIFQLLLAGIALFLGWSLSKKTYTMEKKHHVTMQHGALDVSHLDTIPKIDTLIVQKDLMSGWNIHFTTSNFTFLPERASRAHIPNCGHAHLLLNGEKVARLYGSWFHLPYLEFNDTLTVSLNNNFHQTYYYQQLPIQKSYVHLQ